MNKHANPDHAIHEPLAQRWSPYAFSSELVATSDLQSLFEAARWAPSSYNEQPWRYIVGVKGSGDTHGRILECLAGPNQAWAQHAPVLAIGVIVRKFVSSGKPNKAAEHDLGLASANLVAQATVHGLYVHQMIGLDPDAARSVFSIPNEAEALTALAIGYRDTSGQADASLRERDEKPRERRPLAEWVFSGRYGESAQL